MSKERRRAMLEALAKPAITDLTGYTWVGNNTITPLSTGDFTYRLNFSHIKATVTAVQGAMIYTTRSGGTLSYGEGFTQVTAYKFSTNSWIDQNYKTINILGGTDATNANLIAWLEANGTLTKN